MAGADELYISADLELCQGYVNCTVAADSYFVIGDDGKVRVTRTVVDPADLDKVEDAISSCPAAALSLSRSAGQ